MRRLGFRIAAVLILGFGGAAFCHDIGGPTCPESLAFLRTELRTRLSETQSEDELLIAKYLGPGGFFRTQAFEWAILDRFSYPTRDRKYRGIGSSTLMVQMGPDRVTNSIEANEFSDLYPHVMRERPQASAKWVIHRLRVVFGEEGFLPQNVSTYEELLSHTGMTGAEFNQACAEVRAADLNEAQRVLEIVIPTIGPLLLHRGRSHKNFRDMVSPFTMKFSGFAGGLMGVASGLIWMGSQDPAVTIATPLVSAGIVGGVLPAVHALFGLRQQYLALKERFRFRRALSKRARNSAHLLNYLDREGAAAAMQIAQPQAFPAPSVRYEALPAPQVTRPDSSQTPQTFGMELQARLSQVAQTLQQREHEAMSKTRWAATRTAIDRLLAQKTISRNQAMQTLNAPLLKRIAELEPLIFDLAAIRRELEELDKTFEELLSEGRKARDEALAGDSEERAAWAYSLTRRLTALESLELATQNLLLNLGGTQETIGNAIETAANVNSLLLCATEKTLDAKERTALKAFQTFLSSLSEDSP